MKNKKGVTLIALIITIIVMIILTGVAITLTSGESGVINKAEDAGEKQNYAMIEERVKAQSEYITHGENAGKVNLEETKKNIDKFGFEEVNNTKIVGNILKVTLNNGKIIEISGANGGANGGDTNLVFGKKYAIEGGMYAIFSEKYNRVFAPFGIIYKYYYDETNNSIYFDENDKSQNIEISEDGKSIKSNITGLEGTCQLTDEVYTYSGLPINKFQIYNGYYYCEEIDDFFRIIVTGSDVSVSFIHFGSESKDSTMPIAYNLEEFNRYVTTYPESNYEKIRYKGYEYVLVKSLE